MKKTFTTIIILLGAYTATFAQQKKGDVELGVNTGVNFSTVINSQATNTNYHTGFNAGVAADYYFSDRWSIKAKALYDQKGWNNGFIISDQSGSSSVLTTNFKLNYISIPVMANWHFGKTRNWYLNFGPYVGILTSASETASNTDLKDYLNSTDFGLALGIGVKIPVSEKVKVFFEYDGQSGFTDIVKNNQGTSLQNNRGSLNVGLNFILK
ncbi:Outer membrane protein beta-barrel domain-containing protein [Mucilaginibacter pineti]|uniref:Outer membrane protein beta-barrel domain-containing protein n=1 Tax=Mucilaginibacter pineti TaxID=1391627 RepID=A0A1G7F0R9_9SPHI|nr:porin family protein [Mucilaginibacter pineti]SDE69550.1 Outer membrane protein beta-barrel domain-containing protein [Mucilaginibacter pineti]